MKNFGFAEKIILSIALFALVVLSYFLYDDSLLFPKANTSALENIGRFVNSENDVRRKNTDTFSWIPASGQTQVFQKDSIFTGNSSSATIKLKDGTLISIEPDSLITLNMKNGQMTLDLKYGDLQADLSSSTNLVVKSGTDETKLESTGSERSKVRLRKAFSGLDVNLESGNAALMANGKRKNLSANEKLKVTKNGDFKLLEKPILEILTENSKRWLKPDPSQPIKVSWKATGSIDGFEVQLSKDKEFKDLLLSEKTKESQFPLIETETEGLYYWRITVYDSSGNKAITSEVQNFSVDLFHPPTITNPIQNSLTEFEIKLEKGKELAAPVRLTWETKQPLNRFNWQISKSSDFSEIFQEKETINSNEAVSQALSKGVWYTRIKGFSEAYKAETNWSLPVSFEVKLTPKKELRPAPPILAKKQIEFTPLADSERTPASPQGPIIEWSPTSLTTSYRVQFSKDKEFTNAPFQTLTDKKLEWTEFTKGTSFYRVFAIAPNGLISMPSEVGEILVGFKNPILTELKSFEVKGQSADEKAPPQSLTVQWTPVPSASAYNLEMSTGADFKNPVVTQLSKPETIYVLETPGTFHFRVQALDKNNQELTEYSNVQNSVYTWKSPLGIPILREPFNKSSIFLQKEMEAFIWLEWKKVEGAKGYTIEVSSTPDFKKTIIQTVSSINRHLIKSRLPQGVFYWRVRANSENIDQSSDWAGAREFTIHSQKNETFVK